MTQIMRFMGTPLCIRPQDKPIPGLLPAGIASLNVDAPRLAREAIDAGRSTSALVLWVEPTECTLVERAWLGEHLRDNRLSTLAKKMDRVMVPRAAVLVFIDCDETNFLLVPLRTLIGASITQEKSCSATR